MAATMKGVVGTIGVLLVIAVIAIGGWQLGWWIKGETVNRNARIQQDSYGRQNALVEQVYDDIKDAEIAGLPASQRVAIVAQVCDSAAKLTGSIQLSASAAAFVAREC